MTRKTTYGVIGVLAVLLIGASYSYLNSTQSLPVGPKPVAVPWAGGNAYTPCPTGYFEQAGICLLNGEGFDYVDGLYFSNFSTSATVTNFHIDTWTYRDTNGHNETVAHIQFSPEIGVLGCKHSSLSIHNYDSKATPVKIGQVINIGYSSWYRQFDIKHNGTLIHSQNYGCSGTSLWLIP